MHERAVWEGVENPFDQARQGMAQHHGLALSKEQIRQQVEGAGEVYEAIQEQLVTPPLDENPIVCIPQRQMLCVDAAKVRVIDEGWRDAKTLTIGEVLPDGQVHRLSYFSRMAEHRSFAKQARGESLRRHLHDSREVAAVMDGADYNQDVVDVLRVAIVKT